MVAKETGAMKGRARVLDSTPLHDAVATQDTVTQLRAGIRKLLGALDQARSPLAEDVRAALERDDAYDTVGKPPCDWDDRDAREALVDAWSATRWVPSVPSTARPFQPVSWARRVAGPRGRPRHPRGR